MKETQGAVTFFGSPLTLVGELPVVGTKAPAFTVLDNDLKPVSLAAFAGKTLVLVSVPSLDTPVCDIEARRFNEAALKLADSVVVAVVSMDLPFAQKRWCGAAGVNRATSYSDHREASLGLACGLLIKELRLLARAVLVVDQAGIARYVELVKEITMEPDYAAALKAVGTIG